jgi:tetratricopeptide (TPR) repeat protein
MEAGLASLVRVGGRSWEHDPLYREGLWQHARDARGLLGALATMGHDGGPGLPALVEQSLGLVERAAALPRPPGDVVAALAEARLSCLPALPTYGAVDAALREGDRQTLIGPDTGWRLLRGTREPGGAPDWMQPEHDDADWEHAVLPVGDGHAEVKTVLADRQGRYTSVYARRRFDAGLPAAWSALELRVRHDAGFIAYLNGVEIYREAAGGSGTPMPHDAVATRRARVRPDEITLMVAVELLRPSENVIALQGLAAAPGAELFLDAQLEGLRSPAPRRDRALLDAARPAPGAFARAWRYLEARLEQRAGRAAAVEKLRTLLDEDPESVELQARLAECLRASGQEAEAARLLRRALASGASFPDDNAARLADAARSALRRPSRDLAQHLLAARWALRAERLHSPLDPQSTAWSGAGFYRLGLYEESLERLNLSRSLFQATLGGKEYPAVISFLAMTLVRLGRADEARRVFQVLSDPRRTDPWSGSPHVLEAARLLGAPLGELRR